MNNFFKSVFIGASLIIISPTAMSNEREHLIFLGNPGSGKSLIINSIIGKEVFQSDIALGSGIFEEKYSYEHTDGRVYIDTPGLADISKRAQAAKRIEKAFKGGGTYTIFVVLTIQNGRVKPEDIATIESVLDAVDIPIEKKKYSVIINQVRTKVSKSIKNTPGARTLLSDSINSGKYKSDRFFVINFDRKIEDDKRQFIKMNEKFNKFLFNENQTINLESENVKTVDVADYEKLEKVVEEFAEKIEQLGKEQEQEIKELEKQRPCSNSGIVKLDMCDWQYGREKPTQPPIGTRVGNTTYITPLDVAGLAWKSFTSFFE